MVKLGQQVIQKQKQDTRLSRTQRLLQQREQRISSEEEIEYQRQLKEYEDYKKRQEEIQRQIDLAEKEKSEWEQAEKWVRKKPEFIGLLPSGIQSKARILQERGLESYELISAKQEEQKKDLQEVIDRLKKIEVNWLPNAVIKGDEIYAQRSGFGGIYHIDQNQPKDKQISYIKLIQEGEKAPEGTETKQVSFKDLLGYDIPMFQKPEEIPVIQKKLKSEEIARAKEDTFFGRSEKYFKGRSLIGKPLGALEFFGAESGRYVTKYITETPELYPSKQGKFINEYGDVSIIDDKKIGQFTQLSETDLSGKKAQYKKELEQQSTYFFSGLPYMVMPYGATSFFMLLSGVESYTTEFGQKRMKEQAENWGKWGKVAYVIPAVEITGGALGLRQAYFDIQYNKLISAKEVSYVKAYKLTPKDEVLLQYSRKTGEIGGFPTSSYESVSMARLQRIGKKVWQIQAGSGTSAIQLQDLFTGKSRVSIQPFSFSGTILSRSGRIVKNIETIKLTKEIKNAFLGDIRLATYDKKPVLYKDLYGGLPIAKQENQVLLVSGNLEKGRFYKLLNKRTAILKPDTLSLFETVSNKPKIFEFGEWSKKAQVPFTFERTPQIKPINIDTDFSNRILARDRFVSGMITSTSMKKDKLSPIYLVKSPVLEIEREIQKQRIRQLLVPKSKETQKDIQKLFQTPKVKEMLLSSQRQISVPKMMEISVPKMKTPSIRTPLKIRYRFPIKIPPLLWMDLKSKEKQKQTSKTPKYLTRALLPDFTTRMIGIESQTFKDEQDVERAMKKVMTGLEIRRGARILK